MKRLVAVVAAGAWLAVAALPAYAAVVEVKVGNFYFEDASSGDGRIDANVGDQLRFVVQDGGGGTPHTVEVDALNIHSGSLAAGETFTTGALSKAGRFTLYCKPHDRRGHVTMLIVHGTATTTTSPTPGPTKKPTTQPRSSTPAPGPAQPAAPATSSGTTPLPGSSPLSTGTPTAATSSALAPTGRGKASPQALEPPPAQPGSLTDILGREPATAAPWTRAIRQGLAVLLLLAAVAGCADLVARARGRADPQPPA